MTVQPLSLHQRLHFDLQAGQVLDQSRRYLLMRTDVFMGLFNALPPEQRMLTFQALAQSVTRHGADSVKAYALMPGVTSKGLLAMMADSAAALGWGNWQFADHGDGLRLTVRNSPFAAYAEFQDMPACHAITGMLEALGLALWGRPCSAHELSCASGSTISRGSASADCLFELRPLEAHSPFTHHPLEGHS